MSKVKHTLLVRFKTPGRKLLYGGPSYYRENLIDWLEISEHRISIEFSREKRMSPEGCLSGPISPLRIQLQRALCYYLAISGTIPPLHGISLSINKEKTSLQHRHYTATWRNCRIPVLLDSQIAPKLFNDAAFGKHLYTALSYFVKAQLDSFVNDRFRASFSGFNALYSWCSPKEGTEAKKIKAFWERLGGCGFENSLVCLKRLEQEGLWRRLNWYNYVKGTRTSMETVCQLYFDKAFIPQVLSLAGKIRTDPEEIKACRKHSGNLAKAKHDPRRELKFLVSEYVYTLRNRAFHGVSAYPVFVIERSVESWQEEALAELLLNVLKDAMAYLCLEDEIRGTAAQGAEGKTGL